MQNKKKLLWRALVCACLALFGVELALRLFPPESMRYYRSLRDLHVWHPVYRVGLEPKADMYLREHSGLWEGRFTTNSLGYRGSREPEPGVPQIGCLGDSLVMGFGVSDHETFCARLDGIELDGVHFQTQNLGVDAFGSRGYADRLEEATDQLDLHSVLLFVSPNDYAVPPALQAAGVRSDDEVDLRPTSTLRVMSLLTKHSYLLHMLNLANRQLRLKWQLSKGDTRRELVAAGLIDRSEAGCSGWACDLFGPASQAEIQAIERECATPGPWNYLRCSFYMPPEEPRCNPSPMTEQEAWQPNTVQCPNYPPADVSCVANETKPDELGALYLQKSGHEGDARLLPVTRNAYDRLIRHTRERDIRLIVVLLPIQKETLYCEQVGRYSPFFDFALRAREYFSERDVPIIDLRKYVPRMCGEDFYDRDAGVVRQSYLRDYFIPGDGHLTATGNRWVARSLRAELKGLVDADAL